LKDGTKVMDTGHIRLRYRRGDLIVKQGDYGISIYEIVSGKVDIYSEDKGTETSMAVLCSGDIFGEMAFLGGSNTPRAASARALEDCTIEVWHPAGLASEYKLLPAVLRYILDQTIKRLSRMNRMIADLAVKESVKQLPPMENPWASRRSAYRKEINLECIYQPRRLKVKMQLKAIIKDISKNGVGVEINPENTYSIRHEPGDIFSIQALFPTGRNLNVDAEITGLRKSSTSGKFLVGMSFVRPTEETKKTLGFFLME